MKTNRIIALILSVIFIFTINVTTFAEEEAVAVFEPGLHGETLKMLTALGVTDELVFDPGTPLYVTRGEFTEVAAILGGIAPLKDYVASFTDVPDKHEFAPYIYAMKDAGYISGVSADLFLPDEPIYFEQAVSVFVKLLGYNDIALATGGYPAGYVSIASKNDLFDGVESSIGSPLLRGDLLELTKNTALCEVLIPTSFGTSVTYETQEGVDLLAYIHKIYRGTGIVEADAITTMGQERAFVGEVVIDGMTYKKDDDDILKNSVGRKVDYFYKKADSQKVILYAGKNEDVKEVSFSANSDLDFNYANGVYTFEDEKIHTFRIGGNYKVIYNMAELYPVTEDKMLPSSGTVTLIDNDGDSTYETIIVDEYINIISGGYNEALDKVVDIIDSTRVINFKDYETYTILDHTGAVKAKNRITKDDIIEFYESVDGTAFTAIVTSTGVEQPIDSIDEKYVYSGSNKFIIASDLRESLNTLILGNSYNVYVNSKGELAYWTRGADFTIGYLVDVKGDTNGFSSEVSVKILNTVGILETKSLADKVRNVTTAGMTFSTATLEKTQFDTIFPERNYRELIAYKLNADGEISTVYHAMSLDTLEEFRNPVQYPLYAVDYYCGTGVAANLKGTSFDKKILFSASSNIIVAPPTTTEEYDENSFYTSNSLRDVFYDGGRSSYTIPAVYTGDADTYMTYMTGDSYPFITHLVCHDASADPSAVDAADDVVVSDIRYVYDTETQENKVIIVGASGKATKNYEFESADVLKRETFLTAKYKGAVATDIHPEKMEIKVGDIVGITTNYKGEPKGLVLLYDREHNQRSTVSTSHRHTSLGTVEYVSNGAIDINQDGTLYHFNASALSTWVFEKDLSKNYAGGVENIEVGDTVFVLGWSTGISAITVYKRK